MFFGKPAVHFSEFFPLFPLTEVSPRPSAISGGNPPGDGQSAVGWGYAGFEPETAGQQSGALPLSHHASLTSFAQQKLPLYVLMRIYIKGVFPFFSYLLVFFAHSHKTEVKKFKLKIGMCAHGRVYGKILPGL